MTMPDIFDHAAKAADAAVAHQFGATGPSSSPSPTNAAGDYWTLVY